MGRLRAVHGASKEKGMEDMKTRWRLPAASQDGGDVGDGTYGRGIACREARVTRRRIDRRPAQASCPKTQACRRAADLTVRIFPREPNRAISPGCHCPGEGTWGFMKWRGFQDHTSLAFSTGLWKRLPPSHLNLFFLLSSAGLWLLLYLA